MKLSKQTVVKEQVPTFSKRERRLIDFYTKQAEELEKAGNHTEAVWKRKQAEKQRQNAINIREVFADAVKENKAEIRHNLSLTPQELAQQSKQRKAAEEAAYKKILEEAQAKDTTMSPREAQISDFTEALKNSKKGAKK